MVFSSLVFLYLFLPLIIIAYFLFPKSFRNILLLIASLIFYAWGEPRYVFLMLISILVNYVMGIVIDQTPPSAKKKRLLILTLVINIAILGYYKYAGFFIGIWEDLFHVDIAFEETVTLPIGISFYTFQAMSYIIDVYRQEVKAQRNLIDLSLFIFFIPSACGGSNCTLSNDC